jgi:hypothetical protein
LAASSKLPNKVDEKIIRKRFEKLKKLIPQSHIKIEDEGAFSVTNEMGYIM